MTGLLDGVEVVDRPPRLLFVHAHPDDETLTTGVALAHHRARGDEVHVLTCTLGEEGEVIPEHLTHLEGAEGDPLAAHRRRELTAAMDVLGVTHHLLGADAGGAPTAYRDSGMAGSEAAAHPRAWAGVDLADAAAAVRSVIDAVRPDVVVTYDASGGYRHPDHVRTHEATCRALAGSADAPRLYAVLTPLSWAVEDRAWLAEHVPADQGFVVPAATDPFPSSVVPDELVTHRVVDPSVVPVQVKALTCHETQVVVGDGWYALSNHVVSRLAGREGFALLDPATGRPLSEGSVAEEPLDPARFRQAMGRLAAGVTVVTTFIDGHDHAMTADTVTSVSLDPLLVLVCVETEARWHDAVLRAGVFGVSVLAADQRPLSEWFATRGRPLHGQLDRAPHHRGGVTGVALLDGSLMHLECRTTDVHPAGDHAIVVAEVVSIHVPDTVGPALVHFRGRYGSLA